MAARGGRDARALARNSGCACCPRNELFPVLLLCKALPECCPVEAPHPQSRATVPTPPRPPPSVPRAGHSLRQYSLAAHGRKVKPASAEDCASLCTEPSVVMGCGHSWGQVPRKGSRHLTPQLLAPRATLGKRHRFLRILEFAPNRVPTAVVTLDAQGPSGSRRIQEAGGRECRCHLCLYPGRSAEIPRVSATDHLEGRESTRSV